MATNDQGRLSFDAVTVAFDPPIPILRVPLPACQEDDPSKGPFVLAFQDEHAWLTSWHDCEVKIAERCEAGARMGCSINAAKKCKPPWWHNILSFFTNQNYQEGNEECEEREMQSCLASAKSKCVSYAKDTCVGGFSDARIVDAETMIDSKVARKYRLLKEFSKEEAARLVLDRRNSIKQKPFDAEQRVS